MGEHSDITSAAPGSTLTTENKTEDCVKHRVLFVLKKKSSDWGGVGGAKGTESQPRGAPFPAGSLSSRVCYPHLSGIISLFSVTFTTSQESGLPNLHSEDLIHLFHIFLLPLLTLVYLIHPQSTVFLNLYTTEVCLRPLLHPACPLHLGCQNENLCCLCLWLSWILRFTANWKTNGLILLFAGGVARFVECLPCLHKARVPSPALHNTG